MSDEQQPVQAVQPQQQPAQQPAPAQPAPQLDNQSDPVAESAYEIDEDEGTVATVVGSLGNPGSVEADEDDEDRAVVTEVGALGWPEEAENEPLTGPDGEQVPDPSDPSWRVEKNWRSERRDR
jgi:hypothetical protein